MLGLSTRAMARLDCSSFESSSQHRPQLRAWLRLLLGAVLLGLSVWGAVLFVLTGEPNEDNYASTAQLAGVALFTVCWPLSFFLWIDGARLLYAQLAGGRQQRRRRSTAFAFSGLAAAQSIAAGLAWRFLHGSNILRCGVLFCVASFNPNVDVPVPQTRARPLLFSCTPTTLTIFQTVGARAAMACST